jgi:hypothetical protein
MKPATITLVVLVATCLFTTHGWSQSAPTKQQLEKWHKQFPAADTNRDGTLSPEEATAYRKKLLGRLGKQSNTNRATRGAPRQFKVDAGWDQPRFPDEAVCYKKPAEIKAIYEDVKPANQNTVVSFPEPTGRERRIVATGHSFMAPGFNTLPKICKAAGIQPMLYTHTGGGITGSARYKWEQENGIFQFEGSPVPKLLASISNADWDAMMFGPYFNDKPEYYSCWIDFCLKFNPDMKFYLSDAWPQLYQLGENPTSESFFTEEVFERLGTERRTMSNEVVDVLRRKYPDKVFVLPTSDAMVLAAQAYLRGDLPGIEGVHRVIGGKQRSLWKDQLGHLGPGFERLEGYVFYATLYGESPEQIKNPIAFGGDATFPNVELDQMFRKIAWQAVTEHPYSGVKDEDGDGTSDSHLQTTNRTEGQTDAK